MYVALQKYRVEGGELIKVPGSNHIDSVFVKDIGLRIYPVQNLLINFAVTLVAGNLRFDAQVRQRVGSIEGGKFFLDGFFRTLEGHRLALHQQLCSAEGLLFSELEGQGDGGIAAGTCADELVLVVAAGLQLLLRQTVTAVFAGKNSLRGFAGNIGTAERAGQLNGVAFFVNLGAEGAENAQLVFDALGVVFEHLRQALHEVYVAQLHQTVDNLYWLMAILDLGIKNIFTVRPGLLATTEGADEAGAGSIRIHGAAAFFALYSTTFVVFFKHRNISLPYLAFIIAQKKCQRPTRKGKFG